MRSELGWGSSGEGGCMGLVASVCTALLGLGVLLWLVI